MGLAIPPRIRFLRKYQDAIASKEKNSKKSADLEIEKLSAGLRNDETDDEQEEKETFKENNRDKSSFVCGKFFIFQVYHSSKILINPKFFVLRRQR